MTTRRMVLAWGLAPALILALMTAVVHAEAAPVPKTQPHQATWPGPGDRARATPVSGSRLLTCGFSASQVMSIGAGDYQTLRTCSLTVPEAGQIFVTANGSVGYEDAYSRALFRIAIGDDHKMETDRYVAVYGDTGDGSDASVALSGLFDVQAGSHDFSLLGIRSGGTGTMKVYDPTLSLLYIPGTGTDLLACSDMAADMFMTTSDSYVTMRSCSLSIPDDGWIFISADASAWGAATPFEAAFDVDIDGTDGSGDTPRYVDAYHLNWDPVDRTVALTMLKPVTAGSHTFNFLVKRWTGIADVRVVAPALTVVYIPDASADVVSCGVLDGTAWTTMSGEFSVIRQCSLNVPEDSWALMAADASVAVAGDAVEAHVTLDIDDTSGDDDVDRYANVYADSHDGTDHSVAVSVLKPVTAGSHTFYYLGRTMFGAGTTLLRYPTLTVLVPVSRLEAPVLISPAEGAELCSGKPTFTWNGVEGATSHQIQIHDFPVSGPPEIDETVMGASYTVQPGQALRDGLYVWQVRGLRPGSTGAWSPPRQFTISSGPAVPTLLSPVDGSTTDDATPEFRWSSVPRGVEYRIMVGRDASFGSVVFDSYTTDTFFTPATPLAQGTYYWKVRARDNCGSSDWSAAWQLTAGQADHAIYLPLLIRGR